MSGQEFPRSFGEQDFAATRSGTDRPAVAGELQAGCGGCGIQDDFALGFTLHYTDRKRLGLSDAFFSD
jgi:hypothetical protein